MVEVHTDTHAFLRETPLQRGCSALWQEVIDGAADAALWG